MKKPQLCLNINKRNSGLPELVEELSMEDNLTKVDTVYKILKEEKQRRIEHYRSRRLLGVWKILEFQMLVLNYWKKLHYPKDINQ